MADKWFARSAKGTSDLPTFDPDDLVLITDPKHYLYDERAVRMPSKATIESIKRRGIIEPVVVTPDGDKGVVIAGRRRVVAAREANRQLRAEGAKQLVLVPVITRRGKESELFAIKVSENEQRVEDSPIARARNMQRARDYGWNDEMIAEMFNGCTTQTVQQTISLLDLHPEIQAAIEKGDFLVAVAVRDFARLPKDKQIERFKRMKEAGATKGAAARQMSRALRDGKTPPVVHQRMLPRTTLEHVSDKLAEVDNKSAVIIRAVVRLVLGDPRPLGQVDLPDTVKDAIKEALGDKKKKKSKAAAKKKGAALAEVP